MELLNTNMQMILLTLLACGFKLTLCYHYVRFFFINQSLNWYDAKTYCREHQYYLATVTSLKDNNELGAYGGGWIGLSDLPEWWKGDVRSTSWWWSFNSTHSRRYHNWSLNKPDNLNAKEHCALMKSGQWDDANCDDSFPYVCFNGSEPGYKEYIFVSTNATWLQARGHCRRTYTELALITDEDENAAVASVIPSWVSVGAWLGLSRSSWRWDGPGTWFSNWAPGQPDNNQGSEHCVTMGEDHLWRDANCSLKQPFFCRQVFKTKARHVKLTLRTAANLSDPTIYNQIIEQIGAQFSLKGYTDFRLTWKRQKV